MKIHTMALAAAAAALLVSISQCAMLTVRHLPGYGIGAMVIEMGPVQKILVSLAVLIAIGAFILGPAGLAAKPHDPRRPGNIEIMLWLAAGATLMLGGLAWGYGELVTRMVLRAMGPVSPDVTAPGRAQGFLALGIGLFGSVVSLGLQTVLAHRRANRDMPPGADAEI